MMRKPQSLRIAVIYPVILVGFCLGAAYGEVESKDNFSLKPLRDPFWPVGFYPDNWMSGKSEADNGPSSVSDWDAPTALIRVNGTSRLGDQVAAIINGEVKSVGDLVEIRYSGRVYQWKLLDVQSNGKVRLERFAVQKGMAGVQKETRK